MKTNARLLFFLVFVCGVAAMSGAETPTPRFRAVGVETKIEIGYGVAVADVDTAESVAVAVRKKTRKRIGIGKVVTGIATQGATLRIRAVVASLLEIFAMNRVAAAFRSSFGFQDVSA
jgi:hypothetical protein